MFTWKHAAVALGFAAVLSSFPSARVLAQGPPGGLGKRGQFSGAAIQVTPEMQAKRKAWQKYNDLHKGPADVQRLFPRIEQMDGEPGFALTKVQAGKLLAIVKPWRRRTEMSNAQAGELIKSVTAVLTAKQTARLATIRPGRGGMGRGEGRRPGGQGGRGPAGFEGGRPVGPPNGPRPGGPPPGARPGAPGGRMGGFGGSFGRGNFTFPDPPKHGYNPLNPSTLPIEMMRPRAQRNLDDFTARMQARAK